MKRCVSQNIIRFTTPIYVHTESNIPHFFLIVIVFIIFSDVKFMDNIHNRIFIKYIRYSRSSLITLAGKYPLVLEVNWVKFSLFIILLLYRLVVKIQRECKTQNCTGILLYLLKVGILKTVIVILGEKLLNKRNKRIATCLIKNFNNSD